MVHWSESGLEYWFFQLCETGVLATSLGTEPTPIRAITLTRRVPTRSSGLRISGLFEEPRQSTHYLRIELVFWDRARISKSSSYLQVDPIDPAFPLVGKMSISWIQSVFRFQWYEG